jgi:ATP-dependent protease ClpP protease subunit
MKALLIALLVVAGGIAGGYAVRSAPYDVVWEGGTDLDMFHKIQADLATGRHLRVQLLSPGGPAVLCLEMARMIRNASDRGQRVEIHGQALVASCGTFILAAGTPGHRYITSTTLFLVHPLQRMSFSGGECVKRPEELKTEEDKVIASLYDIMAATYARLTGKSKATVTKWLACGEESVGADMAVEMGIADKIEA